MRKLVPIIFILALAIGSISAEAQDQVDNQLWLDYYHYYNFKQQWLAYGDAGFRSVPNDFSWMMIYTRPSIAWEKKRLYSLSGGIGLFYTFNKDTVNNFEIRPWQGFKLNWPNFKHVRIYQYVRMEERFNFPVDTWILQFNLRFRYKLGLRATLYTMDKENKKYLYLPASVEFFANVGPMITETFSNRSRFTVGFGYRANPDWAIEFDFTLQGSRTGDNQEFTSADRLFQFKLRRYMSDRPFMKVKDDDYAD